MKNAKRNKKRTLTPEVDALFNIYCSKVNKIVPFTTMADWPSHAEMKQSSEECSNAKEQFLQSLKEIKEKKKGKKFVKQ